MRYGGESSLAKSYLLSKLIKSINKSGCNQRRVGWEAGSDEPQNCWTQLNTASPPWVGVGNDVGAVWRWGQEGSLETSSFSPCTELKPRTIKLEKQESVLWFDCPE